MKLVATLTLAAAALVAALPAHAQFAKPEDAIKYRKASMTIMAAHFGRVAGMAAGRIPFDATAAANNAAVAEQMSKLHWPAFMEGSGSGDTGAKPEIWSNAAGFKAAADKLQTAMTNLSNAAKGGNLDAIKAAVGPVGGACKGCHDDFRKQ